MVWWHAGMLAYLDSPLSPEFAKAAASRELEEAVDMRDQPLLVVFSGGTAFNGVAGLFLFILSDACILTQPLPLFLRRKMSPFTGHLQQLTQRVAHVLPVSDDGGSTAEIVRVLGGPAVGDIRSRCLRLADDTNEEVRPFWQEPGMCVYTLLEGHQHVSLAKTSLGQTLQSLALQAEAVRSLLAHRLPGSSPAAAKAEWHDIVDGEHDLWRGVSEPYKHTIRAFLVYFNTQIQRQATERFNFRNGSVGALLLQACTRRKGL